MYDIIDVNTEFEKIFGSTKLINLFDTVEEYETLRQYVMGQPKEKVVRSFVFPFDGIELLSYNELRWRKAIDNATRNGYRIFYIEKTKPFCRAAGYFDVKNLQFFILEYSYIALSDSFVQSDTHLLCGRSTIKSKCLKDEQGMFLTQNVVSPVTIDSASYVLGKKSRLIEWHDKSGKSLTSFFPILKDLEKEKSKQVVLEKKEKETKYKLIMSILNGVEKHLSNKEQRHLFYYEEQGKCKVCGYFEKSTSYFYILKDSLVAKDSEASYSISTSGNARLRFLDKACKISNCYYRVIKDAKCRSASAAACYAIGRKATFLIWRDVDGNSLEDIYPEFFAKKPMEVKPLPIKLSNEEVGIFYLFKTDGSDKYYDASGIFDKTTNQFCIRKGSVLSFGVSADYRYTSSEYQRRRFISLNCKKSSNGYLLIRDAWCESPNTAAAFVLGRAANGWIDWKNKDGLSLKSSINEG